MKDAKEDRRLDPPACDVLNPTRKSTQTYPRFNIQSPNSGLPLTTEKGRKTQQTLYRLEKHNQGCTLHLPPKNNGPSGN